MAEIKKVLNRIYEFDLKNCEVADGDEMISTDHGNEFVNTFIKRDLNRGIVVTPAGYTKGLIYKSNNDGEIYNKAEWLPDIVTFSLNIFGLKKDAFYRVSVEGRNTKKYNRITDVTDDRTLEISNNAKELLLKHDFSDEMKNVLVDGIFRATGTEENLYFRVGKIYISNIIIEEIELQLEQETTAEETEPEVEFSDSKSSISAYGVYESTYNLSVRRYTEVPRITGKGLNLYFDNSTKTYILERDNTEDILGESFTNANYIVDFCFDKAPYSQDYEITDVSMDPSPNTLKQGYIAFQIMEGGKPIRYDRANGRLAFVVRKIL